MQKEAFEPTGLIPRSIIRTFDRFLQQLLPGSENVAIQEYKVSRYQILVSIQSLFILVCVPLFVNYAIKFLLLMPLTEHFWNSQQKEIFLNKDQEKRAFAEMQDFSDKVFFESLLREEDTTTKQDAFSNCEQLKLPLARASAVLMHSTPQAQTSAKRHEVLLSDNRSLAPVCKLDSSYATRTCISEADATDSALGNGFSFNGDLQETQVKKTPIINIAYNTNSTHASAEQTLTSTGKHWQYTNSTLYTNTSKARVCKASVSEPMFASACQCNTSVTAKADADASPTLVKRDTWATQTLPVFEPMQPAGETPVCKACACETRAQPILPAQLSSGVIGAEKTRICPVLFTKPQKVKMNSDESPGQLAEQSKQDRLESSCFWYNSPFLKNYTRVEKSKSGEIAIKPTCLKLKGLTTPLESYRNRSSDTRYLVGRDLRTPFLSGVDAFSDMPFSLRLAGVDSQSTNKACALQREEYNLQKMYQYKSLQIAQQYNEQSIYAITNMCADFCSICALYLLSRLMRAQIIILKSFLVESVYSLSDTTKSFLLILIMDLLVGFHSPRAWEIALETILRHFGFPENENFVLLFVALFPVFLDTVFKYWIFRYLNKISPSTVVTYHSMLE